MKQRCADKKEEATVQVKHHGVNAFFFSQQQQQSEVNTTRNKYIVTCDHADTRIHSLCTLSLKLSLLN